jgi:hypothetical protein
MAHYFRDYQKRTIPSMIFVINIVGFELIIRKKIADMTICVKHCFRQVNLPLRPGYVVFKYNLLKMEVRYAHN